MADANGKLASRGGEKLDAALGAFQLEVAGLVCADFGCNVGGFTDCLLRRGAARVYAVDTGYGELAWKLRKDPRVVVMERTNALYCPVPEPVDLVVADVGWTPQELVVPAAGRWLKSGGAAVSLLKPHYEAARRAGSKPYRTLDDRQARQICLETCRRLAGLGWGVSAAMVSPLLGKGGNTEFLLLLGRAGDKEPDGRTRGGR